jgi:hypothetical protein
MPPPIPVAHSTQAKKDKKSEKMYVKKISELAQIVQQQHLENKKLENLFSDSKMKSLQLSLALRKIGKETSSDPWDKLFASEVSGSYYAIAEGRNSGSWEFMLMSENFCLKWMVWWVPSSRYACPMHLVTVK